MEIEKANSDWSDLEIQAAVDAYLSMLQREQSGLKINKAHENRVLREPGCVSSPRVFVKDVANLPPSE